MPHILHSYCKQGGRLLAILLVVFIVLPVSAAELPPSVTRGPQPILDSDVEVKPFKYPEIIVDTPTLPVIEEDDPQAPRMEFKSFELLGVVERPDLGITKDIVTRIANDEAFMIAPMKPPYGFTIGMFEHIANTVTYYYRSKGFFLARAYIPEQVVEEGVIKIQVIESFLDRVVFDGNEVYSDEQLAKLFSDQIGQPIFIDSIEQKLFLLNDYPGVEASSIFGPGTKPGSAAMLVKVKDEKRRGFVSFDNYGSVYTGENRLRLHYDFNNTFNSADRISMNLLANFDPEFGVYGDLSYVQPILNTTYRVGGGISYNQFDVGQELADLGISGESVIANVFINKTIIRSRLDNFAANIDLSLKNVTSSVIDTVASEDKLTVFRFDLAYSGIDRWKWPAQHSATASISIGVADFLGSMDSNGDELSGRRGSDGQFAGGDFSKLLLSYTRSQPIFELQTLLFRYRGQYTSDLLVAIEQFSLGGPDTVRAYPVAEALVDNATFLSIEWIAFVSPEVKHTWLNKFQFSVFYDYAKGSKNDPIVNEVPSVTLGGAGFSVQVKPFDVVSARIDYAFPVGGDEPTDNRTLPFYFRIAYDF